LDKIWVSSPKHTDSQTIENNLDKVKQKEGYQPTKKCKYPFGDNKGDVAYPVVFIYSNKAILYLL